MDDGQALRRPVGWWLKEADSRLEAAFEHRLAAQGVTRRGWQVLASVARAPIERAELVAQLAAFEPAEAVEALVDQLGDRGWLASEDAVLRLTPEGRQVQSALAAEVSDIRGQVAAALPTEDYLTLIRLLARLVDAFPAQA